MAITSPRSPYPNRGVRRAPNRLRSNNPRVAPVVYQDKVPDIKGPTRVLQVLDSSVISVIEYDVEAQEMYVAFRNPDHAIWKYTDVPVGVFGSLASAESVGSTFSIQVRGRYPEEKIYPKPAAVTTT